MDVKYAFLNGILEEEIYIEQPNGFALLKDEDMVCKLQKAHYGLKQAPRAWYERLHSYLIKIGFIRTSEDSNVYLKIEKDDRLLIAEVFVDDIIFYGNDEMSIAFADEMRIEFEMLMFGEIKFFIGLQISQLNDGIYINQTKYVREVLKNFGLEDSKPVETPMVIGCKLSKEDDSKEVNATLYRSMIGKLQYVVHSRPNIAHAVEIVSRFQANPKESHMVDVKRNFRSLKGTEDYGLWYDHKGGLTLSVFTDIDWAGNVDDRKSTSGGSFFLGERLVSCTSKKKNCISQSTEEAEYVVAINCTQVSWMK